MVRSSSLGNETRIVSFRSYPVDEKLLMLQIKFSLKHTVWGPVLGHKKRKLVFLTLE